MVKNRVIPSLLLLNEGLVKTINFKNPIYIGDPLNAVKIFNEKEVDELMLTDITASKENKNPNYELIEKIANECFMPLTYCGGISNLDQVETIFSLGVEKVCIQTSAYKNSNLISKLAEKYGSQSIMVSVDVKKNWLGKYELYSSATGKLLGYSWKEKLIELVDAGAGEVLLNSVDKDGTLQGPDLSLISKAAKNLMVPLIAIGGISNLTDIRNAIDAGADAVAAGSFFVFVGPHRAVLITYPNYYDLINILVK